MDVVEEVSRQVHHDRIFLNNPVMIQGMGLAPLVVVATNLENALMLALAVAILLTPTRVIAGVCFSRLKSPLLRVIGYTSVASIVYIGMYLIMSQLMPIKMLNLGIYLPILVVEPLIIYRYARVTEPVVKACLKGIRMTVGYALVLVMIGAIREVLAVGTLYGITVLEIQPLPLASIPAGGFILIGVICAGWRSLANRYRKYMMMEARQER